MLSISGLTKSFAGRRVLDGLDLTVAAGESVALLGGNGSGKTTTLRSVVGLVIPDGGGIVVAGIDARTRPRDARANLSFLPQKSAFPPTLRVREALGVAARLRGLDPARVEEEIARCGLAKVADQSVATLSGGERQRVGLAIALLPDVALYLFDEPSANLDPESLDIFFDRARGLFEMGRSVLFTTHVGGDVEALATRVEVIADGRLRAGSTKAPERSRPLVAVAAAGRRVPWRS